MAHIAFHSATVSVPATCGPNDAVGDLVYVTGPAVAGVLQVARADIASPRTMPAVGVITAKTSPSVCRIAVSGVVRASGLTAGARYFVGTDGRPTPTRPAATPGGQFIQTIGVALDSERLAFVPSAFLTKVIS